VPIVGGDAMSSPGLMAVAGPAAEGVIVASFFHPEKPGAAVPRFDAAFRRKYGTAPDAGSALGYDCVQLLVQAMRRAKSTVPDDVAAALQSGPPWPGVTATFSFDEHGEMVSKPITLSVVRHGRFEYLAELAEPRSASVALAAVTP